MGKKFDDIYESVTSRYQAGGYLSGDFVKFRPNYKTSPTYKNLPDKIKLELDDLVKSGLNIRITQIGNSLSGHSAGNQHKTGNTSVITVAGDSGGGRYYNSIPITPDMIDLEDQDANSTGKIPDQFRRKNKINIKPEVYNRDPKNITNVTDKGDGKNTPTDLKLAGESTRLKNSNADLVNLYEQITK